MSKFDDAIRDMMEKREQALKKAGLMVEGEAKARVSVETGHLRNNITSAVTVSTQEETRVRVGTNVEYAPFLEFGTGIYADNGEGRKTPWVYENKDGKMIRTVGNKPQPFLLPSIEENLETLKEMVRKELEVK